MHLCSGNNKEDHLNLNYKVLPLPCLDNSPIILKIDIWEKANIRKFI